MPKLTLEEMETHFSITADDRGTLRIYSDDPVWQRKLEAVGAVIVKEESDRMGKHYTLPASQFSLHRQRKPMPEERRVKMAAQLAKARKTLDSTGAE